MGALRLTRDEARWLAVVAQGLDRRPFRRSPTKAEILATIRRIGCVQLDTISVISRSHETVLWSRLGSFDVDLLGSLYDPDHALTEYWAHAAAIIPVELLPLFRTHMEWRQAREGWSTQPESRVVMDRLLAHVAEHGPMSSLDFDAPEEANQGQPWDWYGIKPERRALDALWSNGELVLRRRDGFRRVFDLPERIVPELWQTDPPSDEERVRELGLRSVSALGIMTHRWLADYFRTGSPQHIPTTRAKSLLAAFAAEGIVVPVEVAGIDEPMWIDANLVERLELMREGRMRPTLTTLLSPFDNLIWNRPRTELLWDFFYRIEVYTPAPKRVYGYYSLPILHRGKIVGRLDPSFDRKAKVLTIKALHLESGVRVTQALATAVVGAIEDLLRFLGGEPGAWRLLHANPATILPLLDRADTD